MLGKMTRINEAPKCGQYLIYTRKSVLFEHYDSLKEIEDICNGNEILEMHLFDQDKEYRAIATKSKRFPSGVIEYVSEIDDSDSTMVYIDHTAFDSAKKGSLDVWNHISYDDNGMITIDDYRLVMGGEE